MSFPCLSCPTAWAWSILLIGIWVFRQRGNQRTSQVLALFAGTASIIFATYFDGLTTNRLQWVAFLAIGASSGAILSLSLLFPQTTRAGRALSARCALSSIVPGLILATAAISHLVLFRRSVGLCDLAALVCCWSWRPASHSYWYASLSAVAVRFADRAAAKPDHFLGIDAGVPALLDLGSA